MKKIKYYILGLSLMTIGFFTGGCADSVKADNENLGKYIFSKDGETGNVQAYTMVDTETKVNYIVVRYYDNRGAGVSVTVTPRLAEDGSIYTSK